MENRKKIIIAVLLIAMFAMGGFSMFGSKKSTKYGYELTEQKPQMIDTNATINTTKSTGTTISTGTIVNPSTTETLAYVSTWNGDVKREQNGISSVVSTSMSFSEGDSVTTAMDANAEIIFADNSVVRMNANSRLSFVKLAPGGSEVRLDEGDIWARVLKPFYDTSFFTISTSDVSAGVQGTSVRMRKTLTGTTDVAVIDSYSDNKEKE